MKKVFIFIIMLFLIACSNQSNQATIEANNLVSEPEVDEKPNMLILVGNEFGNTYFDMKAALEERDFIVTTLYIGDQALKSSCPNHENIEIQGDISLNDLDESQLTDYFGVFIPAGKHHRSMIYSTKVHDFLSLTKEKDLYISSVCAGNLVLASTKDLLNDVHIATSSITYEDLKALGANCQFQTVVRDGFFITGSQGGGLTGTSHEGAPIDDMADQLLNAYLNQETHENN